MNRFLQKIMFVLLPAIAFYILSAEYNVMAGQQSFETPKENPYVDPVTKEPTLIAFANGSFEIPNIKTDYVEGAINAPGPGTMYNYIPGGYSAEFGWMTEPVNQEDRKEEGKELDEEKWWNYCIEIQSRGAEAAQHGLQYAELNAEVEGRLYQHCNTIPGQRVYYEYYHKGRDGLDTMHFYLCAPGEVTAPQKLSKTDNTGWKRYYGVYEVPAGQYITEFAFESVDAYGGKKNAGNHLDNISLSYPAFLEIVKSVATHESDEYGQYALAGETITYTIEVENNGETATSRTVLTDIIPDGLELDLSSVRITYTDQGGAQTEIDSAGLTSYDNVTDTLTVYVGKEIANVVILDDNDNVIPNTAANGTRSIEKNAGVTITYQAVVTGTNISFGDEIQNQVKVIYNDLGYEQFNQDAQGNIKDDYNVSNISSFRLLPWGELDITKQLTETIGEPQQFVFQIDYRITSAGAVEKSYLAVVTIAAGQMEGKASFSKLRPGYYQITEQSSNWQYELAAGSDQKKETVLTTGSQTYSCIFTNQWQENAWIQGKNHTVNQFT